MRGGDTARRRQSRTAAHRRLRAPDATPVARRPRPRPPEPPATPRTGSHRPAPRRRQRRSRKPCACARRRRGPRAGAPAPSRAAWRSTPAGSSRAPPSPEGRDGRARRRAAVSSTTSDQETQRREHPGERGGARALTSRRHPTVATFVRRSAARVGRSVVGATARAVRAVVGAAARIVLAVARIAAVAGRRAMSEPAEQASQKLGPSAGGGGVGGGGGSGGGVKIPASKREQLMSPGGQPPSIEADDVAGAIGDEDSATPDGGASPPVATDAGDPGVPPSAASGPSTPLQTGARATNQEPFT